MWARGRASSWAAFGNVAWAVAATGGQSRHGGAVGSQARLAQPWAGASPAQQEVGGEIWSPKPCWGQGRGGGGALGWGNELWWLWNVTGPCGGPGALSVPGQGQRGPGLPLSQVGQEGRGVWLQFGLSRTQMSQCWVQLLPGAQRGPRSTCSLPGLAAAPGHSLEGFHARGAKPGPGSVLCSAL